MIFINSRGFYPNDRSDLLSLIEYSFLNKKYGPGYIPKEIKKEKDIISGIVPHSNYNYLLPNSINLYKDIYENFNFDTLVIIGPNHSNLGISLSLLLDDWYTSIGTLKTDILFGRKLINSFDIYEDPLPFKYEHSVQVNLPIIRYLFNDIKILTILVKKIDIDKAQQFAKVLKEISEELGRKIFVLFTGNLLHHGPEYSYIKYEKNITENIKDEDNYYINKIINLDSNFIYKNTNSLVFCGKYPFIIFIEYNKLFDRKFDLYSHISSSEINGSEINVVDYFSLLSYK
ncbi:MEMO1 family protein [Nanobdella aerobiophila]|uniref:MEMO1 family protein n=1 Tax=Nanobdella aerobiophila TaxID=2586965 RepID=A0A915SAN5_9ARCH|nr:AmmeMemoRadiSam system protein B [Nanobdella aerobiophila]BBL45907.1 MEMO1 family protein [Nanobdella aerobiophila]